MSLRNRRDSACDGGWFVGGGQTRHVERHYLRQRRKGRLPVYPAPSLEVRPIRFVRPDCVTCLRLMGVFRGAVGDGGEWAYSGGAEGEFGGHKEAGLLSLDNALLSGVRPCIVNWPLWRGC